MHNEMARVGPRYYLYRSFCVKQSGFNVFRFVGSVLLAQCLFYLSKTREEVPSDISARLL
jgi:hypothetical protein